MSDTPRTDAVLSEVCMEKWLNGTVRGAVIELCRALERENAELRNPRIQCGWNAESGRCLYLDCRKSAPCGKRSPDPILGLRPERLRNCSLVGTGESSDQGK